MDKRSAHQPKFFTGKASRSPSKKPQFDMRTVLFKADHLKAATARSAPVKAYTYKFFSSKNPVTRPPVAAPVSHLPAASLQSKSQTRIRNGSGGDGKRTCSPNSKRCRSENTENITTVSQSNASSDRISTRSTDIKSAVQPIKQSKRQRGEEPDVVNPSVITGRRLQRLDRSTRQAPVTADCKQIPAEISTSDSLLADTTASSSPLPLELETLSKSEDHFESPNGDDVSENMDLLQRSQDSGGEHTSSSSSHSMRLESDQKVQSDAAVISEPQIPLPPAAAAPVVARKKFFRSKNTASLDEGKKQKPHLDFKKFFTSDFDDSFAADEKIAVGKTPAVSAGDTPDEYVTMQRLRKAHQCHEMGETESFDEDIRYKLNSLEKTNSIRIRCLSIEALTSQCMEPEFRMHLRAHDDMPRIICALSDAPSDPNLAFCTAALMFVYNQDRLTMDIDPNHLSLMLDLLEVKEERVDKVYQGKAKEQVEQMKSRGHGKFLDPSNLSAGKLALEALLGLTSKRAGDWFKEELRNLKGLDFLMNTVIDCVKQRSRLHLESELTKVDRTLRVLEAATLMHEENQLYTIQYQDGEMIRSCTDLLKLCKDSIVYHSDCKAHLSTLLSVLRVFTNVTSESGKGSHLVGSQFDYLLNLFLDLLFEVPSFVLPDARFDLMVLLLCLCINMVEFHEPLRQDLLDSQYKLKNLVEILLSRVQEAKETEQQADDLLDSAEKDQMTEIVNIDTLLNQVVAKSGKHMEHSIVAACVSLLLGCSIQESPMGREIVAELLPDQSFEPLVDVLRKLHEFAHLADIMTPSGVKRVEKILRVFQSPNACIEGEKGSLKRRPSSPSLMSISDSFLNETESTLNQTSDSISF